MNDSPKFTEDGTNSFTKEAEVYERIEPKANNATILFEDRTDSIITLARNLSKNSRDDTSSLAKLAKNAGLEIISRFPNITEEEAKSAYSVCKTLDNQLNLRWSNIPLLIALASSYLAFVFGKSPAFSASTLIVAVIAFFILLGNYFLRAKRLDTLLIIEDLPNLIKRVNKQQENS